MYTEKELQISNKSYTNKDFQSIFPELLDLAKKLTNKWDPSSSNESDPGVVLLKLGALLADKNNYNMDKNILETFPLSVTQRANAWKLYDMLGYSMGWYKAAVTDLTITYTGEHFQEQDAVSPIIIPKYTMFTDDSGQITYTLIEDLYFNEVSIPSTGQALQGTIHDYQVNGVTDITLDNLDSELRLFFTDRMIAQNGIFITNKGSINRDWRRVDNLESETLGSPIYKFGIIPNTDTCYIQFPQDIGNLIGGGLNIKYIITSGLAGNVKANVINSFLNEFVISEGSGSINDDFIIKNIASTSSGSDPEDIDSAYRNYKKTIGTFDTLVTIRDYENALRRAEDGYGRLYVSNAVVSDRTCDLNYTTKVVELTPQGNITKTFITKDDNENSYMDAFDIGLYVLNPSKDIYDSSYYYNKSFCPIQQQADIRKKIEEYKVSSHDYIDQEVANPYIYKNFYTLVGKVHTYYKVTEAQAEEIEENIKIALYKRYNARNVEFGQPVNYDDVLQTIQQADTRIKTVLLAEPEYKLRYTTLQDNSGDFSSSHPIDDGGLILKLLARMILAGNVQLYKFDRDIVYRFGQTEIEKYQRVTKIKPINKLGDNDISGLQGDDGYTVKKNQNIQLVAPNLYVEKSYVSYVNYALVDSASNKVKATYDNENKKWVVVINGISYEIGFTVDDGDVVGMYLYSGDSINPVIFDSAQDLDGYVSGKVEVVDAKGTLITARMLAKYEITEGQFNILSIEFSYGEGTFVINQGSYYRLKESQSIYINYTDSNGKNVDDVIRGGTIVRFTDNTNGTSKLATTKSVIEKTTIDGDKIGFSTLTASQQIDVLSVNKKTKDDRKLYCLWFTNDYQKLDESDTLVYTLFKSGQTQRMLQDNEYFMYTDERRNELVVLGSGTIIQRTNSSSTLQTTIKIKASDVISDGLQAIDDDTDWYPYNAKDNNLTFIETQIVTLGENAVIKATIIDDDKGKLQVGESAKVKSIKYKENKSSGSFTNLTEYDIGGDNIYQGVYCGWTLSSKINLMTGRDFPQELSSDDSIELSCINDKGEEVQVQTSLTGGENVKLLSNSVLAFSGGSEVSIVSSDGSDINIYKYVDKGLPLDLQYGQDNCITLYYNTYKKVGSTIDFEFSFNDTINRRYTIPVVFVGQSTQILIKAIGDNTEYKLNKNDNVKFIQFTDSDSKKFSGLSIASWSTSEGVDDSEDIKDFIRIEGIYVSPIVSDDNYKDVYSEQLYTTISECCGLVNDVDNSNNIDTVVDMVKNEDGSISNGNTFTFNETYIVPDTDKIDTEVAPHNSLNNLFANDAVWDINHICNKFTIPQLNTDTLSIKVAASSLK